MCASTFLEMPIAPAQSALNTCNFIWSTMHRKVRDTMLLHRLCAFMAMLISIAQLAFFGMTSHHSSWNSSGRQIMKPWRPVFLHSLMITGPGMLQIANASCPLNLRKLLLQLLLSDCSKSLHLTLDFLITTTF